MSTFWIVVSTVFVVGVLTLVAYVVFELTPFARHSETFRDPRTLRRIGTSPHLETRDEFEHRTAAS